MKPKIIVALTGNPNSGKTTIFNELTGARQHVGNYPGVTVERKEGSCRYGNAELQVVDLPGTYSLTAYSAEELVARNFIIEEKPDVVVDIIDTSNLERNLYLAVQLMELGVPLILAFNMSDTAKARGYDLDIEKLSGFFGAHIVQTVGHKGIGMKELLDTILTVTEGEEKAQSNRNRLQADDTRSSQASIRGLSRTVAVNYGREIEKEIDKIETLLRANGSSIDKYEVRWFAMKLLENDKEMRAGVVSSTVNEQVETSIAHIEKVLGEPAETAIAGARYGFISGVCR
ncbi:MAG: FeoB small GTPase domain-containing protein, partial [Thermodesulfobacteriota bacterium]|nr:FeoB small GTPase domain-containing protein [Thermodesulfobacteriota bacterium]